MKLLVFAMIGFINSIPFFLFNNIDLNFKYFILVIILDFLTGIICAYINKKIKSGIIVKGICKKIGYFAIIIVSNIIGNILELKGLLQDMVIYCLMFNEIISILENCSQIGIKTP